VAMFASPRRRCGLLRLRSGTILSGHLLGHGRSWGRRSCKVPGCLKSESEERETWTAGSLRAAFREGETSRENGQEETSAVDVLGQHPVMQVTGDGPRQTL
jgi:hypothetical protein